ncbi:unnamed protein product [Eruca vesicaria subsp. sativa]|uniref:RING-type E3 ubiquitin transferase n=1 Tax=Eruca vesicaria subsp. sativa TaxID=29727 RepID=A0ABC8L5A6_ERUVS|nr:unnamed protein product [Eruca vesicaria subsp. sativa]
MASGSYWCYSCNRFVWISDSLSCPDCNGGFLEHIHQSPHFTPTPTRFPHAPTNHSPNPVILLRGASDRSSFQMYYDDSGLRPLPPSMTEFLLGSGFDRLLDQISRIELNANRNGFHSSSISLCDHPPASKSAVEGLPEVEIGRDHLESDCQSHCAVCKENFEMKSVVREMPCSHVYHPDCILPWLAIRNSCPVCRHELPADEGSDSGGGGGGDGVVGEQEEEDFAAGLTIWRLPGGGFAVGRIPGGDRVMPVVYTEVDGGRMGEERLPLGSRRGGGGRERGGGGFAGRIMRLFGCFSGSAGSIASGSGSRSRVTSRSRSSLSMFSSGSSRRRNWLTR